MCSQATPDPIKLWLAKLLCGQEPGAMPDEAKLLATARSEGVLALCHDRLRRLPAWNHCSMTLRTTLTQAAYQEVALEMVRAEELRKVLATLAQQNLPVMILKGAALAYTLYPKPHLRSRCDTDLLFSSMKDAERASKALQIMGYKQSMDIAGDLIQYELNCCKITSAGVNHDLDIHWGVSNCALFANRFSFFELKAKAVSIPELSPHAYGLNQNYALLLACMHRINNLWPGTADRLIWIYDIYLITSHLTSEQWKEFALLAEARELCGPCLDGLYIAHKLFNTQPPEDIRYQLQKGMHKESLNLTKAHTRWQYKCLTFRHLPIKIGLRWLLQHFFPTIKYLKSKYNFKNNLYSPWFYGLRFTQEISKEIALKRNRKPKKF